MSFAIPERVRPRHAAGLLALVVFVRSLVTLDQVAVALLTCVLGLLVACALWFEAIAAGSGYQHPNKPAPAVLFAILGWAGLLGLAALSVMGALR